jgi:hypothetical protein
MQARATSEYGNAHGDAEDGARRQESHGPSVENRRSTAILQQELGDAISGSGRQVRQQAVAEHIQHSQRAVAQMQVAGMLAQSPRMSAVQRRENRTGLPDELKSGIESLSGQPMDHVRVHYNSGRPAQLNALAYAQGADIHVGPGQERHLPHEAWHVVQQAQGRVAPTMQLGAQPVNDDRALEREADAMGERALSAAPMQRARAVSVYESAQSGVAQMLAVIQAVWGWVDSRDGDRVNLQNLGGGTFRHNPSGRLFTADADDAEIFHLQAAHAQNEEMEGEDEAEVEEAQVGEMDEEPDDVPDGPLRAAFRAARAAVEERIERALTAQEWDVVADHASDAIDLMRNAGLNPVTELSGPNGASCIPTSDRLFAMLGAGQVVRRGPADQGTTAARLEALAHSIENEAADSIYQVVFNPLHHGFVIVVSEGMAEITQSFANSESLGTNLESHNFTFTQAEVAEHLRNFLDAEETEEAQVAMFEGRIDGNEQHRHPIAAMQLSWNRANLRADAAAMIANTVDARATALLPDE